MKTFVKASLLLATSVYIAGFISACAPYEAVKPKKDEKVREKVELPDHISDELAELLLQAMEADPKVVFGAQVDEEKINAQGFVNLFDLTGQGVIQGVSVQKTHVGNENSDGKGKDRYQVDIQVFARGADLNRELMFSGEVMNSLEEKTNGFKALELAASERNFEKYVDCREIDEPIKEALKKKEAYSIKAYAACFDLTCDTIAVQLQLQNNGGALLDSRVGLSVEDKSSPGKNTGNVVVMTMKDATLKALKSFEEAQSNKEEEKIDQNCKGALGEEGDGTLSEDEERARLEQEAHENEARQREIEAQAAAAEEEARRQMDEQASNTDDMIDDINAGVENESEVDAGDMTDSTSDSIEVPVSNGDSVDGEDDVNGSSTEVDSQDSDEQTQTENSENGDSDSDDGDDSNKEESADESGESAEKATSSAAVDASGMPKAWQ